MYKEFLNQTLIENLKKNDNEIFTQYYYLLK